MWLMILLQPGGIQLPGSAKVHFLRDHGGTRYPGSSSGQFPIFSSLHILPCFSICYTVLKSCLYELDSCSRWMAYSHLFPFRCCGWTCLLSKTAEAWPRALWNQPFYLLIGLYTELTVYSSQLQKQYGPFPNLPCPKPGTEQIVIISFILLPVFFSVQPECLLSDVSTMGCMF